MATTTNFTCNKDARVAQSGSTEMGSGTSDGLPFGTYSGYKYRTFLGFSVNMAGWTSITKAELWYKSSNQIHVAFGSDPTFVVQRVQAAWSEGSSSGLSTGNAVIYPGPSTSATNGVQEDAPTAENTWGAVDITAMMRDVLGGAPFYGLRIIGTDNSSSESGSASNVGEIYSRESGSGTAYLKITYETNRAPDAPTVASPDVANGGLVGTQTPTLNVTMTDPDGNAINNYHWQIDDNADFSSPIQDVTVGSGGANGFTAPVVPAALPRGGTYYFRAQAADVSVWGGWSTTFSFKVASPPALTVSEPSASGRLARLQYDAGSGWGSPRMVVNWALTCPDGGTQLNWQVTVYNDSAGAPGSVLNDSGIVGDTQSARIVPANLIEGNYYHVVVSGTCSHGLVAVASTRRVRARWGVSAYMLDMGATPIGSLTLSAIDVTDQNTGGSGQAVLEYQTAAAAGLPATWSGTIGGAGLLRYFYYRVWLLAWGASPAVSPTLNNLVVTYTTSVITPDKWAINDPANQAGDVGSFVYGTKSLRMKGKGAGHAVQQVIDVVPDTNYILSGRVQTSGDGKGRIDLLIGGATVANSGSQLPNIEFEDPRSRMATPVWNSGNNTQVTVRCVNEGAVGTTSWFDALKMEASTVVTPWSPGYVANAVVLDAGGLQIDASQGGIFRLKGSAGGARDSVELGANGLRFGDNVDLYSPSSNLLRASGAMEVGGYLQTAGIIYPTGGVSAGGGILAPYHLSKSDASGVLRLNGTGTSAGAWAKIASGTIPGQYWSHQISGYITTRYGVSEIACVIHADAGPAAQPSVTGTIRPASDYGNNAIHAAVVVVRSVNPIVYEVWVQVPGGYAFLTWYPDIIDGEGSMPVIENPNAFGWQALPAGSQYALNLQVGVRFQMGSTARNVAAANGTVQGVVTFPVPFQNTPFVWAYANASAGNAAYVTIQSVSTTSFDLGLKAATAFNYTCTWMAISHGGYNA